MYVKSNNRRHTLTSFLSSHNAYLQDNVSTTATGSSFLKPLNSSYSFISMILQTIFQVQTLYAILYPITALSQAELTTNGKEKCRLEKYFCSVNVKNISSHNLRISEILLVLRTREFTDIFITVDEICFEFTSQK